MNLSHILDAKGSAVVTSPPHRTISEIVALLAEKGIGAVVITSADGDVLGILSERDVIRAVAQAGGSALLDAASKHMTSKVVSGHKEMTLVEALSQMTNGRFRHLPVLEDGRLAGLISIGDAVKHRLEDIEREKQSMLDYIGTA